VYDSITHSQLSKNIVDVLPDDLVWDGIDFVHHAGVVFSGYAEVVSWGGITGTKNHVVFTKAGEIGLLEASARGEPIKTAENPTDDDVDAARIYARCHKRFDSM
jgi:hypothetical protein